MRRATWKLTLDKQDRYGRKQVRTVNLFIDIRDFTDKAIFPYLLMAANPLLSAADIAEVLPEVDEHLWRSQSWISKRLWMCRDVQATKPNADGLDEKAHRIMAGNPRLSHRKMAYALRQHGISRSPDWVRRHRVALGTA